MRKILFASFLSILFLAKSFAINQDDKKITIRNHTDTPMNFFILGSNNMEYFSDLIKMDDYSETALVDKKQNANFILHAMEYPASFAIAILEHITSSDDVEGSQITTPVCIIGSVRTSAKDPAFGSEIINYQVNDKYKCKVVFKSIISIWPKKSVFSIFSKS